MVIVSAGEYAEYEFPILPIDRPGIRTAGVGVKIGFQLIVGGHHHVSKIYEKEILAFDACGKYADGWAASSLTLKDGIISLKTINTEGETILEHHIDISQTENVTAE